MKISRKFATSLDILVGTNLVANATVLVAISSPGGVGQQGFPLDQMYLSTHSSNWGFSGPVKETNEVNLTD